MTKGKSTTTTTFLLSDTSVTTISIKQETIYSYFNLHYSSVFNAVYFTIDQDVMCIMPERVCLNTKFTTAISQYRIWIFLVWLVNFLTSGIVTTHYCLPMMYNTVFSYAVSWSRKIHVQERPTVQSNVI